MLVYKGGSISLIRKKLRRKTLIMTVLFSLLISLLPQSVPTGAVFAEGELIHDSFNQAQIQILVDHLGVQETALLLEIGSTEEIAAIMESLLSGEKLTYISEDDMETEVWGDGSDIDIFLDDQYSAPSPMMMGVMSSSSGSDLEVRVGHALIGNLSHAPENTMINFNTSIAGFTSKVSSLSMDWMGGGIYPQGDRSGSVELKIRVADNPELLALAKSGEALLQVGWDRLKFNKFGCFLAWCKTRVTNTSISIDNRTILNGRAGGSNVGARSAITKITDNSVISVTVHVEGQGAGVDGLYLKFMDLTRPVMSGYTFTGNGNERLNPNTNQQELYAKRNENIRLSYNFSEPVKPFSLQQWPDMLRDAFVRHPLFTNPDGTGLPAAGQKQYLQNETYPSSGWASYNRSIVYQYTGMRHHHSGNLPLEPKIMGIQSAPDDVIDIDMSIEEKFNKAQIADAAGNLAVMAFPGTASTSSNAYIRGKTVNPFLYQAGGFRVIVDAVPPKYTPTGNGIQPEILTGVVLNDGDTIDFTVQMSEEVISRSGDDWPVENTFIHFNNGMKARYVSGEGTSDWVFRAYVTKHIDLETPLLKVIAITHESKANYSDTQVIQDYAGNFLIQPANYKGIFDDEGDKSYVDSQIDWATLSIDNTPPEVGFLYESGGADQTTYEQRGRVMIDANDPALRIPAGEPPASGEGTAPGDERPSKGIYRPSNLSGPASPSLGLVYYYWSQSPEDPFADVSLDNFAAIKRYSLSAKQPGEELYPDQFSDVHLQVVNNKTTMIAPPPEALEDENSGVWYLHTWTADMTWDTARQLMQYDKMKSFIADNPGLYESWKQEAAGSEADKIFYADNKAMAAVGQYGDVNMWPLSDFKVDDSNWVYEVGTILLDNQAPKINISEINGDNSSTVQLVVMIEDEHSGLAAASYQWVRDEEQPTEIGWTDAVMAGSELRLSTRNEIVEDGRYWLYVQAVDHAGNFIIRQMEPALIVNSEEEVQGRFMPEADPDYVREHDLVFYLTGFSMETVTSATYGVDIGYALTRSPLRPTEDDQYMPPVLLGEDEMTGELMFHLAVDHGASGERYAHVRIHDGSGNKVYYFSKVYYFDEDPPIVSFSRIGVAYPLAQHDVTVKVTELYSASGLIATYQWVRDGEAAPTGASSGWLTLPADGKVMIDNSGLNPGEVADYRLFVRAVDGAGHETIADTDLFKVSRPAEDNTPPAPSEASLIYRYGSPEDGYTGIVRLTLDTPDKSGYEYSVSPDYGASWTRWRPYTNFVSLNMPSGQTGGLQVKFRTPGGAISDPDSIDASRVSADQPLYALASLSTTRPVSPDNGVDIHITVPLGYRVVPSAVNPSTPVRSGNTFHVQENGYYSFDLTDLNDPARTETLYIVVSNIDSTPPMGSIEYLSTGPTNGNVSVKLHTSEPVQIIGNNGSSVYTFTADGTYTFVFRDEAGNENTATATVNGIHKEGPKVRIERSYQYGDNGGSMFETIRDGNGQVILSSGVTLTVVGQTGSESFFVPGGNSSQTVRQNGIYSFVVSDAYGNVTEISQQVDSIWSGPPQVDDIVYTFVDETGRPLPDDQVVLIDGQPYARGRVMVTLSGAVTAPNRVFSGVAPVSDGNGYTNQISDETGVFTLSKVFSSEGTATMAITDLLGNTNKVSVSVIGIDNKAPNIELAQSVTAIQQNKPGFNFRTDLGGFTVSDNVSDSGQIDVSISGLDLSKTGYQQVIYTATDQVGNQVFAYQDVYVVSDRGMLVFGNDVLLSASSGVSALYDTNQLTFRVERYNVVDVNGEERINEWGTFDLLYYSGLYREGQMKLIASKITYDELIQRDFKVTFPQVGWYTFVIRTQEREREYATFFIGKLD